MIIFLHVVGVGQKGKLMRLIDADVLYKKLNDIRKEEVFIHGRSNNKDCCTLSTALFEIDCAPTIEPKVIKCKDCKYWKQRTNYQSFGFCENNDRWTYTDGNHYCGYAERIS